MPYHNGEGKKRRKGSVAPSKICKPGGKCKPPKAKSMGDYSSGKAKKGKRPKSRPGPGVPGTPPPKKPVPTKYNNVRFLANRKEGY